MIMTEAKKKSELYELLSKIAGSFVILNKDNEKAQIEKALSLLGKYVEADRAFIFKYDFDKNIAINTYEWCSHGTRSTMERLQKLNIDTISEFVKKHKDRQTVYVPNVIEIKDESNIKSILVENDVISSIVIPMIGNDNLYGFVGFNSNNKTREYADYEQNVLTDFSKILINAINRIQLEKDIFYQNKKLDFILEVSEIGSWEWNLKTGELIVNDKWLDIVGYRRSELEPITIDTWKKLLSKTDKDRTLKQLDDIINNNNNDDKVIYDPEFRMVHKDGHNVWVKDRGMITKRENGVPVYMIGTHVEITKVKNREERLKSHIHAIDSTPVGVLITDRYGMITFINPMFLNFFNMEYEDLKDFNAKNFNYELENGEIFNGIKKEVWESLNNGNEWHDTIVTYDDNKKRSYLDAKFSPVYNTNGTITSFVGVLNDITQDKKTERQLKVYRDALEDRILKQNINLEDSQKATVFALAKLTEARDGDTGSHVSRVQHLCKALAVKLQTKARYKLEVTDNFISDIFYSSVLHDIGKIKIPDSILLKPGKLTTEEFDLMKQHVKIGSDTLHEMIAMYPDNSMIIMGAEIAKYHHEKWNGQGYLEGLSGKEIPLSARIMALVDAYDAIRSKRPYKDAVSHLDTVQIIQRDSGTHFDPDIVRAFIQVNEQFEVIYNAFNDKE